MRRIFSSLVVVSWLASGCATQSVSRSSQSGAGSSLPIIDAHLHAKLTGKPNRISGIPVTEERLAQEMRENGIVGAVSISPNYEESVSDLSKHHIVHCGGVGGKVVDKARLEKGLKAKTFSCIKIYLGYVHQYANHPNYHVAYQLARKYQVPVIFHTGDTSTKDALLKYSDPLQIDEVAVQYRDVNFVLAHLGNPWVETAAEVVYKNENVYADVSAFLVGDQEGVKAETWEEYAIKPIRWAFGYIEDPTKLMYGTDWPLTPMKPYLEAVKKAIPKEHWAEVFHDNALRVYKIPGLKPIKADEN